MPRHFFKASPTIRSRVMKAIDAHIDNAEKEYETQCVEIDKQAEDSKVLLADTMVKNIINKII